LGVGGWGVGVGGMGPNPQSPIPNPQSPENHFDLFIFSLNNKLVLFYILYYINLMKMIY
jgi:hypothetical protein